MDFAATRRTPLLALCASLYAVVAVVATVFSGAGLGLGHFFYVPIALTAVVGGPWLGLAGGLVGAGLYDLAVLVSPPPGSGPVWAQTAVRVVTFVTVGVLVGWFAQSNRRLLAELFQLAERDKLTGLPNTRAFQAAIDRRLDRGLPFALVLGDVDELRRLNVDGFEHGDDALRRLATNLLATRGGDDEVARVGGDEFAVLTTLPPGGARTVALRLEQTLGTVTFGWGCYPDDGDNALALYRAADERLYARKVARGYRREPAAAAV